ncbi:MAG: MATE family efflux transporter [Eubacterium sp.]|nr:MATE family efflux transporter [Eubacterium sp.]
MVTNLSEGKVNSVLWKFTIPMFISVVFQQLYNIADSAIAGKFAGEPALAAVGASYPITMIFMAIAIGSNVGCSVVISRYFGGGELRKMKTAVTTTLIGVGVLSLLLTGMGFLISSPLLRLMNTPTDIFNEGKWYLNIYIAGLVFLFLYNVATGIFTSLGDSKTPLMFLIGSSIGNIALDLLFVVKFGWGVRGVGWATFIAQGIACVLALFTLKKRIRGIPSGEGKNVIFSFKMFRRIAMIAIPSILQQSFVSVGNLFIQGLVNSFGSGVLAGYSAAVKLNNFAITSFSTLGNGVSNFTAQNLGAGKTDRVKKGFRSGCLLAWMIAAAFMIAFLVFGRELMSLFLEDTAGTAMDTGLIYLRILAPFYIAVPVKLVADGVLRGSSEMKCFMMTTFSDLILRVVLAFWFSRIWGSTGIWLAWPVGWVISMVMSLAFLRKVYGKINQS